MFLKIIFLNGIVSYSNIFLSHLSSTLWLVMV
jgi:hypothetical protein